LKPRIQTLVVFLLALITFMPLRAAEIPKHIPTQDQSVASSTVAVVKNTNAVQEWKYPQLKRICSCESTGSPDNEPTQFTSTGAVLRGVVNNKDVGMCQINTYYHGATADKLGIDLLAKEGNMKYAEYLYEQQGSSPWSWSKGCWSK
jgi:hypothetical protein